MASSDPRLLLLGPDDHCLALATTNPRGCALLMDGTRVTLAASMAAGHKVARRDIATSEKIHKYGAIIGPATQAIRRSEHVHLRRLASDSISTCTLPGPA